MKTLYFSVKLKTDIILNQKAASEGPNTTLDFIPGSNFLGIVAGALYHDGLPSDRALDLFHNGNVRFGDAHLASMAGARTLKVPAVMFFPKGSSPDKELYLSLLTDSDKMRNKQLKQCRSGFYDFTAPDQVALPSVTKTNFAIKSAHDRITRTSKDKMMYGYESLQAGARLLFSVEVEDEALCDDIITALTQGKTKRVGRSRSAQYGLIEINHLEQPYQEVKSRPSQGDTLTVYADSRLIFLDAETGLPTLQPTPEQLGVAGGEIVWEKSQIRIFQYTPWNFKRQCFDTDRCGIEKGSVFVIRNARSCPTTSQYVGNYRSEGFGRVIYNPAFLEGDLQTALASWKLAKHDVTDAKTAVPSGEVQVLASDSALLCLVKAIHNAEIEEQNIFKKVNSWIHDDNEQNWKRFNSKRFASQWGTIRSIATRRLMDGDRENAFDCIEDELLHYETNKERCGYLRHGVASHSWEEFGRLKAFKDFIEDEEISHLPEDKKCLAIINLAAEMAKMYRKENVQ